MVTLSSDHPNWKYSSGFMYSLEDYNSITATVYRPEEEAASPSQLLWRSGQARVRNYGVLLLVLRRL